MIVEFFHVSGQRYAVCLPYLQLPRQFHVPVDRLRRVPYACMLTTILRT